MGDFGVGHLHLLTLPLLLLSGSESRRRKRKEGGRRGGGEEGRGGASPPLGGAVMQFLSVSRALACLGRGGAALWLIGIKDAQGSDMRVRGWRNSHQHGGLRGG